MTVRYSQVYVLACGEPRENEMQMTLSLDVVGTEGVDIKVSGRQPDDLADVPEFVAELLRKKLEVFLVADSKLRNQLADAQEEIAGLQSALSAVKKIESEPAEAPPKPVKKTRSRRPAS